MLLGKGFGREGAGKGAHQPADIRGIRSFAQWIKLSIPVQEPPLLGLLCVGKDVSPTHLNSHVPRPTPYSSSNVDSV